MIVLKNSVNDKTKSSGIERSHDSFNVYGNLWKDIRHEGVTHQIVYISRVIVGYY